MNCTRCGGEADISVCLLLSTKLRRPRIQKSSKAIQLCSRCIRGLRKDNPPELWSTVREALHGTHTALTGS